MSKPRKPAAAPPLRGRLEGLRSSQMIQDGVTEPVVVVVAHTSAKLDTPRPRPLKARKLR